MSIRPLHALAAAGVVIAAAVVFAVFTRAPAPVPAGSSPSPTAQAVSTTPAATAAPTVTPPPGSERYGLIVGKSVRSEADPRRLGEIATAYFNGAVSPDGRRVAYWETSRGGEARVLRLLEGSAPAQPRVVLTLPETEIASVSTGGGVVWSSDGTGLLIAVNSREHVMRHVPDAPPLYVALRQVDLASGSVREIARRERGLPLQPVAWDRARGIAAAVETSGAGYHAYILVRDGAAPTALAFGGPVRLVGAAPDASRVITLDWRPAPAVYVWPLAEPERRTTLEAAAGERVATAMWRNAREIVVSIETDAPGGERLEVWPLEGPRRVLLRAPHRLQTVRPDGSAAIASVRALAPFPWPSVAVDLGTGATWPIRDLFERVDASFLLR